MKTSDTITKIAPALLSAQKAITFAAKDAINPHLKSKYADLPSVIDAVKGALNDNGIMFSQTATESEPTTLRLTTRLIHESGEWIEDTATMPIAKTDPQGYGSAMTYCRRYTLAAITGLYQDDDDGQKTVRQAPTKTEVPTELAETAMAMAKQGIKAYETFWKGLKPTDRALLNESGKHAELKVIAADIG